MKAITDSEFEAEVLKAKGLVLVDFWAEWCGPCRQLIPILEEISKEMGKVKICKINVDESPDKAADFGIRSIPSVFLFKDGKQLDVKVGMNSKSTLVSWIEANL
ncbi:MAG: thioredoxin [Pseudomonadota bacterium]|nr:thioredoxin [Pseudomonadota bacterium]